MDQLATNKFCRTCFVQDENEKFSEIIDTTTQMELLSIGNIEIFDGDGLPNLICQRCKIILSNAYKFKNACKKSDTMLKMYPMTSTIPSKINIVQEPLPGFVKKVEKPEMKSVETETEATEKKLEYKEESVQTDALESLSIEKMEMIMSESLPSVIAPPALFEDESSNIVIEIPSVESAPSNTFKKPSQMKILNKSTTSKTPAKQFNKTKSTSKSPNIKIQKIEKIEPKILNQLPPANQEQQFIEAIDENAEEIQIIINDISEEVDENKANLDKSEDGVVYTCNVCDRSFLLLQQLEIHKQNHERPREHPCEYCEKAFFTKYDLAKHILTHTKQKDFTCVVCLKSFSRSTLLYRHEKIHTDPSIPRYQCEQCDRCYLNRDDYDRHQTTHSKLRPFACNYCDKRFAFKQGLERHEVIHDMNAMSHPCLYCSDRFKSAAFLQRHLSAAHAGTRPFPCSKCSKRFMLSHHLYRHMRTSHNEQEETIILQCPVCEENFLSNDSFFEHCMQHALDTQICPMCKYESENAEDVVNHIELHSKSSMYFCDYCASIFMSEDELHTHFGESHSNELCSIAADESEISEEIVPLVKKEPTKRKQKFSSPEGAKRAKINEIEGLSYVEYEEVTEVEKPEKITRVTKDSQKFTIKPTTRVKMTQNEIKRLQKEGKIVVQNGVYIMKQ